MSINDQPSLELLRQLASSVPIGDQQRYAEIYELLANPSRILWGDTEMREHSEAIEAARQDLYDMLRHWLSELSPNEIVMELTRRYEEKGTFD